MKIQIVHNISECIDGYHPVLIENNTIDLDAPDNSVSSILMINSLELVSHKYVDEFISKLRQLLRINGSITLTGIDINCLTIDYLNQKIGCETFNEIVYSRQAVYDSNELAKKLEAVGIKVDKLSFKGSSYELHASRHK